jgi:DNA-binding LacI/PurR family transcriptional regulator
VTRTKYQQVFDALHRRIRAGDYEPGQKLPSEAALVKQFGTSRITVGRAVRDLQQRGLVERRAGSGTYVRAATNTGLSFGLLIPNLGETEIFEHICKGIASSPQADGHALLWGGSNSSRLTLDELAWRLCRNYIANKVAGVFFAPLELTASKDEVNRRIVAALEKARIPIILLDRCILPYPHRCPHDLVGIDNRRAGYMAAEHLLKLGVRRIAFVAQPNSAPTVDARIAGYREALFNHQCPFKRTWVQRIDAGFRDEVSRMMKAVHAEAVVCANDRTAGQLMHTLLALGHRIPGDVKIVGMDDVGYASLLPVPLTTIQQPCRAIGEAAMAAMLERIEKPAMHPRDVLLDCKLVVRESCGGTPDSPTRR